MPDNITLVPLPSYSPELNPVERVWLYLRERFLSHRALASYTALPDAACRISRHSPSSARIPYLRISSSTSASRFAGV